jgi:hypothetical protein
VHFWEAALTDADIPWVQAWVRQRVLRGFHAQGNFNQDDTKDMA